MGDFVFRHFRILHGNSTMKVGTDAVLVGALTKIHPSVRTILDVGTGCGIIALMLAQRSNAEIVAIDIDKPSVEEATINFRNSPWPDRLKPVLAAFQYFSSTSETRYDLIVSNPPFFQDCQLPLRESLSIAKHNKRLNFEELLQGAERLLNDDGSISLILPVNELKSFLEKAGDCSFFPNEIIEIVPIKGKPVNRILLTVKRKKSPNPLIQTLTLRNNDGKFSDDYKMLTKDFHPPEYFY